MLSLEYLVELSGGVRASLQLSATTRQNARGDSAGAAYVIADADADCALGAG